MSKTLFMPLLGIVVGLSGCTAIDLSKLEIKDFADIRSCKDDRGRALGVERRLQEAALRSSEVEISFLMPKSPSASFARAVRAEPEAASFQAYDAATTTALNTSLPPSLQNDAVIESIRRIMVKTSAAAQIHNARMDGVRVSSAQINAVQSYPTNNNISLPQLKAFADKVSASMLRPTIRPQGAALVNLRGLVVEEADKESSSKRDFAGYFVAYYTGEFVDRLGQKIERPKFDVSFPLALVIPNADIAAAVSVIVEFIVDLVDPTPVLGNAETAGAVTKETKFYPGGTNKIPTAFAMGFANYKQILPKEPDEVERAATRRPVGRKTDESLKYATCGLTQENSKVLSAISNSAADNAALVSGLVAETAGGLEVGLGVLGKISIGDNQTLATIVKTAASRLGGRIGLASAYWTITAVTGQDQMRSAVLNTVRSSSPSAGILEFK